MENQKVLKHLIQNNSISNLFKDNLERLSLYIHIPFCAKKCNYCDFYSESSINRKTLFIKALKKEIKLYTQKFPHLKDIPIYTIFIGGGTPSILTPDEWLEVANKIRENFNLSNLKEWSIECNPESFSDEKAKTWLRSGVNRLSLGVQSLSDEELKFSGRVHTKERVLEVLNSPILKEFDSISIDLIYGLPNQTVKSLEKTVNEILQFPIIKHISAYELTIAEGTPFYSDKEEFNFPDDDYITELSNSIKHLLKEDKFNLYEVSNYAKDGYKSLHNSAYWELTPYLGLGASAHSFDGNYRFSNSSILEKYIKDLDNSNFPIDTIEEITKEMLESEFIMLSLRTSNGINFDTFYKLFNKPFLSKEREESINKFIKLEMLEKFVNGVRVTDYGIDFVDGIVLEIDG